MVFHPDIEYATMISTAARQAIGNTMIAGYNTMSGLSSASTTIKDEISSNVYTIKSLIDTQKVSLLKNMVINYGLAPDYTAIDKPYLTEQKNVLSEEKTNNTALIEELKAQIKDLDKNAQVTGLGDRMESLIVRNNTIDQEIKKIDKQIDNYGKDPSTVEGHAQFVKDTKKIYDGLYNEIDNYKAVMKEVYVDKATVTFANSNVLDVTKSMSLVFSILIPLAAGFVVGIIVNLILDRKMLYEEDEPVASAQ